MADLQVLKEFFLQDYEHVAAAYFDEHKTFTSFFKFYLTIMTAPAVVALYYLKEVGADLHKVSVLVVVFFLVLGLVGYLMSVVLINIRFEILKLAREVNLIRSFFKDLAGLSEEEMRKYVFFPMNRAYPPFYEAKGIGLTKAALVSMALINGLLWALAGWTGMSKVFGALFGPLAYALMLVGVLILSVGWHLATYRALARRAEGTAAPSSGGAKSAACQPGSAEQTHARA